MNPPPSTGPVPARLRVLAVVFMLGGLALGYFFIAQPLMAAGRTGMLKYYLKGVMLGPVLVYTGIVMLFADVRDGQIKQLGPNGQKRLTSKGWAFVVGAATVIGLALGGWFLLLHQLGFRSA